MPRGSKQGEHRGGRRRGTPNKATAARQAQVAASGKTPLEVMLSNMRFADEQAATLLQRLIKLETPEPDGFNLFREVSRLRQVSQDCAKDAAPYIHPRLASVEHGGNQAKPAQMVEFVRARDGKPVPEDLPPLLDLPANVVDLPPPRAS